MGGEVITAHASKVPSLQLKDSNLRFFRPLLGEESTTKTCFTLPFAGSCSLRSSHRLGAVHGCVQPWSNYMELLTGIIICARLRFKLLIDEDLGVDRICQDHRGLPTPEA